MTFKYSNVYINDASLVAGPYEKKGPLGNTFDKTYDDLYLGKKTWEQAEVKLIEDSVDILLNKINKKKKDIDIHISGDLLNQIVATNYASASIKIPLLGIYSACATSTESLIIGANMIEANQIKNCICSVSSHNNAAEKQFRYPVEYGGPKPKTATFTVTGGTSSYLSSSKKGIKLESGTVGTVSELGITDSNHMGAIMASSAGDTIHQHLTDLKREPNYYDLIITGDLGVYGSKIMLDYVKTKYGITIKNHKDAGLLIFDLDNQPVFAGGSGAACSTLVTYGHIFKLMKQKELKKVLLVATGSLLSTTMAFQKLGIPSISHAVSLEVIQ
ncbi:MAG: stage V sporulation protein AD [Bacilli bacterium]